MPTRIPGFTARLILSLNLALPLTAGARQAKPADDRPASEPGGIHGRISVTKKEDSRSSLMHDQMFGMYSTHGAGEAAVLIGPSAPAPGKLSERAAVYLESDELTQGPYPVPARVPSLDQKNLQFHPQVLPVIVGTKVEFPNRDNLFHNVFSYSQAREFDLGRYPKDDSRSVMFDRPGIVRVYCDIHSHMSATILVLKHPYFATPDESGVYAIPRVPPGKYRIVLWYDRDPVERKNIEVKPGEDLQVDFTN